MTPRPVSTLNDKQWNRTLLHRQHLLEPSLMSVHEMVLHLVAIQSQNPQAAFYALRCRLASFAPSDLDACMRANTVVRLALFRSTIMTVAEQDLDTFHRVAHQALVREARGTHASKLKDPTSLTDISNAAAGLLRQGEMSANTLGVKLNEMWPNENPTTLVSVARCTLPLIQVPPRGTWKSSANISYALPENGNFSPNLANQIDKDIMLETAARYLKSFGPSTIKSVQTWLGVSGLKKPFVEAVEQGRFTLYAGPHGEQLFDVAGLEILSGKEHAPARLIAPFDHIVVSHVDRGRIISPGAYKAVATPNAIFPGFVMHDGLVIGTWKFSREPSEVNQIRIQYVTNVTTAVERQVNIEKEALEYFALL